MKTRLPVVLGIILALVVTLNACVSMEASKPEQGRTVYIEAPWEEAYGVLRLAVLESEFTPIDENPAAWTIIANNPQVTKLLIAMKKDGTGVLVSIRTSMPKGYLDVGKKRMVDEFIDILLAKTDKAKVVP